MFCEKRILGQPPGRDRRGDAVAPAGRAVARVGARRMFRHGTGQARPLLAPLSNPVVACPRCSAGRWWRSCVPGARVPRSPAGACFVRWAATAPSGTAWTRARCRAYSRPWRVGRSHSNTAASATRARSRHRWSGAVACFWRWIMVESSVAARWSGMGSAVVRGFGRARAGVCLAAAPAASSRAVVGPKPGPGRRGGRLDILAPCCSARRSRRRRGRRTSSIPAC